jgi:type IX secretion system PorP/SprF family membrane protein
MKKNRIIAVVIGMLFLSTGIIGQERPKPALFMMNYAFLNPALNGVEEYTQVQGGLRRQWMGTDGAPATNWLTASVPLRKKGGFSGEPADGYGRPSVTDNGHGLGISFYQDNIGPYASTNLNVGYAYHLPITAGLSMSGGMSVGLNHYKYDAYKNLYIDASSDPSAALQSAAINSNKYAPDLNVGVMLYSKNFFAGVSAMQLIKSKFVEGDYNNATTQTQLYLSGGYTAPLNETGLRLWVSTLLVSDFTSPSRIDVNSKLDFSNLLWVGFSYRQNINLGTSAGFHISKSFMAAYLYEWNTNGEYSAYGNGSHELALVYKFLKNNQSNVAKMGW